MSESGAASQRWLPVERAIQGVEAGGGVAGVAAIAPGGERFTWRGGRAFHAASTVKVPLMIEIVRRIERGEIAGGDEVTLTAARKTPGSGVLTHLHDGLTLTIDDLLYLMISISDNTATNLLLDLVGLDAVNAAMASLGMTGSSMNRPMLGRMPREDEPENWATPDDYAAMMAAIVTDRAASPGCCAAIRDLLATQQCTTRISRHLPAEGVRWGSKTGSIPGVVNDVGFVTIGDKTLVIACYIEGLSELDGEAAIGEITRQALVASDMLPASSM